MAEEKKEQPKQDPKPAEKPEPTGPAKYRTNRRCYVNDILYEEGAEFEYAGIPGTYMTPLTERAKFMKAKHSIGDDTFDPVLKMTPLTPKKT